MSTKLFIRNLSWSVTENDLYNLFGEVGEIISVKIPTRREDGKPRGFAFVEMENSTVAQAVIQKFNGYLLGNRDIVVDFQDENRGGGGRPQGASSSPKNSKLFIRNLSDSVSEHMLQELFQQAGTVYSVKIATDRDTGESKGFGFIEMASVNDAQQAIDTLNHVLVEGQEINIDFQDPNRAKSKPRAYNRGGSGYDRSDSYRSKRW